MWCSVCIILYFLIINYNVHVPAEVEKNDDHEWISDEQNKFLKAIKDNDVEHVRYLLRLGVVGVDQFIMPNQTALGAACLNSYDELVTVLIEEFGADVNKVKDTGLTPLSCACEVGNVNIVKILLKYGAKVDISPESIGVPPLMEAAFLGDLEIIKILLEHGALKASCNFHQIILH